ncbi:SDR family NAD(P)-dependent oxidoreductase [Methanoregula formicica]|uniref:Putative nucleoside-diphosphate sugar epimerase n=1 Tax=Methanoregula formicica (strain DSM 22288 / NBRC 105244 / SMSP) TaxID=593750 RepID=L0HGY9_METFS|nr:SDR family NAD(P)-dependent oxidoreductase [Methanoregula formicica]AGB02339.1 putative nucleoside-diphosphate sugar epimerase [Methanoregula formicica SMSP]
MKSFYQGKNILITGGAGSVGQALCEKLLGYGPKSVALFDINENALFHLRQKYSSQKSDKIRFLLGDIKNLDRLQYAFKGVDIVIHCASYKHVLECEYNPLDAVETNITGTTNVIQAAINQNVKKVIFTSSDKAANPSNTMGTTKLLAEKLIIAANDYGARTTVFSCCRFGNVVGTSGSVIPLFRKQILDDGLVTITEPSMTRFMITQETAIDLVLMAGVLSEGGEIFIFKMPVVRIGDLADVMISKFGNAKKVIIGKKPGEKMYEEIMTEEEMSRAVEGTEMYVILPQMRIGNYSKYTDYPPVKTMKTSAQMDPLNADQIRLLLEEARV